jgi:hypothetical protein
VSYNLLKIFNKIFSDFLPILNKKYGLKLNNDDLFVIYKGGNVINYYCRELITQLKTFLGKNSFDTEIIIRDLSTDEPLNVKTIPKSHENRGDWDYSIIVNFNLIPTNITEIVREELLVVGMFALTEIKKDIINKLDNNFYSMLADKLSKGLNSIENKPLQGFQIKYGTYYDINYIILPNYFIHHSDTNNKYITTSHNKNNVLDKSSHIIKPTQSGTSTVVNIGLNKIDHVYVACIEDLKFVNFGSTPTNFSLMRLKVNNRIDIYDKTGYLFNNYVENPISADLIDLSLTRPEDSSKKTMAYTLGLVGLPNASHYRNINLNNDTFKFLTTEDLYADLTQILYIKTPLPWLDKKYRKRLGRLFMIGFMCSIKTNNMNDIDNELDLLLSIHDMPLEKCLASLRNILTINNNRVEFKTQSPGKFFMLLAHHLYIIIMMMHLTNGYKNMRPFVYFTDDEIIYSTNINLLDRITYNDYIVSAVDIRDISFYEFIEELINYKKALKTYITLYKNITSDIIKSGKTFNYTESNNIVNL